MGLNLNQLGLGAYLKLGIEGKANNVKSGRWALPPPAKKRYRFYLRWLPAPMKNNMGIESRKFTREASNAVRPH